MKNWKIVLPVMAAMLLIAPEALAEGGEQDYLGGIGIAAGLAMGLAALGGAIGQGMAVKASVEGIARNPQASAKITVPMFAGLALIESLVLFSFVIALGLSGIVSTALGQ